MSPKYIEFNYTDYPLVYTDQDNNFLVKTATTAGRDGKTVYGTYLADLAEKLGASKEEQKKNQFGTHDYWLTKYLDSKHDYNGVPNVSVGYTDLTKQLMVDGKSVQSADIYSTIDHKAPSQDNFSARYDAKNKPEGKGAVVNGLYNFAQSRRADLVQFDAQKPVNNFWTNFCFFVKSEAKALDVVEVRMEFKHPTKDIHFIAKVRFLAVSKELFDDKQAYAKYLKAAKDDLKKFDQKVGLNLKKSDFEEVVADKKTALLATNTTGWLA